MDEIPKTDLSNHIGEVEANLYLVAIPELDTGTQGEMRVREEKKVGIHLERHMAYIAPRETPIR